MWQGGNKGPHTVLCVKFNRFVLDSFLKGCSWILLGFFSFFKVDIGKSFVLHLFLVI